MSDAAAGSSSKSDLKCRVTEITKCPICLDDIKNPKLLPCVHSFCLQCLQEHWNEQYPGDEVSCPVCRKVLEIPKEGLGALPHNFFLQNLIDAIEVTSERLGDEGLLCDVCKKDGEDTAGNIAPATVYCEDCNQKLCKRCSRLHETSMHQVKDLATDLTVDGAPPSNDINPTDLPQPPLENGERVVWISDTGPELGTVRWIGILPDSQVMEYTIGIEFVSIVSDANNVFTVSTVCWFVCLSVC